MTTLALQVPGAFLGIGTVAVLVLGIGLGMAAPKIIAWFDDFVSGLAMLFAKAVVGVALFAVTAGAIALAAGVRIG